MDTQTPEDTLDRKLVLVGRLGKAHGIRGELLCALEADSPELLTGELVLRPRRGGAERRLCVERIRSHHGRLLLSFRGVTTRNDAELLSLHDVFVPKDKLPAPDEDEVYLADLPGLRVFVPDAGAGRGPDNGAEREIGVIAAVDVPAGQEIWTIVAPGGEEILFPAVESFVLRIDLEEGKALIDPPPGLLELYLNGTSENQDFCSPARKAGFDKGEYIL